MDDSPLSCCVPLMRMSVNVLLFYLWLTCTIILFRGWMINRKSVFGNHVPELEVTFLFRHAVCFSHGTWPGYFGNINSLYGKTWFYPLLVFLGDSREEAHWDPASNSNTHTKSCLITQHRLDCCYFYYFFYFYAASNSSTVRPVFWPPPRPSVDLIPIGLESYSTLTACASRSCLQILPLHNFPWFTQQTCTKCRCGLLKCCRCACERMQQKESESERPDNTHEQSCSFLDIWARPKFSQRELAAWG